MLARRSTLRLRSGVCVELPLLVPSFSSKGFPTFGKTIRKKKVRISEATHALEVMAPYLGTTTLVSAYDIHHGLLDKPIQRLRGRDISFLDSGGYELQSDFDSTEPSQGDYAARPFTEADYRAVLARLPEDLPVVIANFDWGTKGKPLNEQLANARELFHEFPERLTNFIVKPTKKRTLLNVAEIRANAKEFRSFDILGVTEKELGSDLLDRLENLAAIRAELDRQQIKMPIHVWGGLDPLITPLYFFAGAEIFDGVSWLRYAFHEGTAIYRDCYGVLRDGLETSLDHARAKAMHENLSVLRRLTTSFQRFVDSNAEDFTVFEWHSKTLKAAYDVMRSRIPELKGGM